MTSEETLEHLRRPTFDNWQWEDAEMMFLVQQMFLDLGLVETFHIEVVNIIFSVLRMHNVEHFVHIAVFHFLFSLEIHYKMVF